MNGFRTAFRRYGRISNKFPHSTAAVSASTVFFCSDLCAQSINTRNSGNQWDVRRTAALTSFGFAYYGMICSRLYKGYDVIFGPRKVVAKVLVDVFIHTPFFLLPAFYTWTHVCENRIHDLKDRLKKDWWQASTASVGYWLPVQTACFGVIPVVRFSSYSCF